MSVRRTIFASAYAFSCLVWMGGAAWLAVPAGACRTLTQAQRSALRGGAPGPCNPINGGACGSDPTCTGSGKCSDANSNCTGQMQGTLCGLAIKKGYNPPQCLSQNPLGTSACINGNPPTPDCYEDYACECDDNGNCGETGTFTYKTGTCYMAY